MLIPLKKQLSELMKSMLIHLDDNRRGERLRDGLKVTIIGRPNVGKSSFLNEVSQRPAAIVNPVAGESCKTIFIHLNC